MWRYYPQPFFEDQQKEGILMLLVQEGQLHSVEKRDLLVKIGLMEFGGNC